RRETARERAAAVTASGRSAAPCWRTATAGRRVFRAAAAANRRLDQRQLHAAARQGALVARGAAGLVLRRGQRRPGALTPFHYCEVAGGRDRVDRVRGVWWPRWSACG